MDKRGVSLKNRAVIVDKHVENVDESVFYELYMHGSDSIYAVGAAALREFLQMFADLVCQHFFCYTEHG